MKSIIIALALAAIAGCGSMTPEQENAIRTMGAELHRQGSTQSGIFTPTYIPVRPLPPAPVVTDCQANGPGAVRCVSK